MICATWNAPSEAFDNPAQRLMQGKSPADLFLNITSNRFCGYEIMEGYNCFNIFRRSDIAKDLENYPSNLKEVFRLRYFCRQENLN
jgi:modulator of drug activity B